jgi:hypothetical protein
VRTQGARWSSKCPKLIAPGETDIPEGSKLVGHVIAVQPSQPGQNSQMALQFDRVELKGGKTMPVHSQIQSISPAEGAASVSGSSAIGGAATNGSQAAGTSNPGTSGAANGDASASGGAQGPGGSPGAASVANGGPPPGTELVTSSRREELPGIATHQSPTATLLVPLHRVPPTERNR